MAKQHEAKLVDPVNSDHFDVVAGEGGEGIDRRYGVTVDGTQLKGLREPSGAAADDDAKAGQAGGQPGDIHGFNSNHEPGTGRFAHGGGGSRKLSDAGANAASEAAHAASKSAHAFTGSHATAASAHMEAAAAARKVQQRSQVEFEAALARKDQLGAIVHSTEATNAATNHATHLKKALEHEHLAKSEAEHAIRTGLAGQLPAAAKPGEKKPSMIGKLVGGLARGTGKATVAVVKAPFQVAAWAIRKAEAGRKERGEQRASDRADEAATQAGKAAESISRATQAAKDSPVSLPGPRPRNPDAFTVDPSGNVRRPGAMPLGLPAPGKSTGGFQQTVDTVDRAYRRTQTAGPDNQVDDAEWEFKSKVEKYNQQAAASGGKSPPMPPPRSSLEEVQSPGFDSKRAGTANSQAMDRLRKYAVDEAQRQVDLHRKGKTKPYRSWEVPEAAEPVSKVAAAILAVRANQDHDLPAIEGAATDGEFASIHADAVVDITAAQSTPGKKPRFVIKPAYNGGPLQVGAYKLPIIVDLAGMSVNAQSVAANLHHDSTKLVGHADDIDNNGQRLNLAGPISGAGLSASEFKESHANGFPWKASIEARPLAKPELVPAGKSVKVNGRTFSGPVLVARKTELYGVAFVPRGADDKTSVNIAAAARAARGTSIEKESSMEMTFAEWLEALGLDEKELKAEQVTKMKAKHQEAMAAINAAGTASGGGDGAGGGGTAGGAGEGGGASTITAAADFDLDDIRAAIDDHAEELTVIYAEFEDEETLPKKDLRKIQAEAKTESRLLKTKAIQQRWSPAVLAAELRAYRADTHLKLLRASRPTGVTIASGRGDPNVTGDVLAAALMEAGKYHLQRYEIDEMTGREKKISVEKLDDVFAEETLEASHKLFRGGIGLQELILEAAQANGYQGRKFPKQYYGEVLQAAFCQGAYASIHAAGESTVSLDGILSNYLNKFLLQGFYMVEQVWRQICSVKSVNDFKTNYSYRMTADSMFLPVGSGGEIKRGSLGDEAFTNKADTYAKGFSIPRPVIINDDLNAMIQVPIQIGRGSGLQINDMFWRAFLDSAAFWKAAAAGVNAVSYRAGADTALSIDSMTIAETLFMDMKDDGGNPIGHQPEKLLVPVGLGPLAAALFNSAEIRDTTAATKYPVSNPHTGKYRPIVSRYLANSNYPGYSAKAWHLLGDQNVISVIEMCFLFGQEAPTIESSQANFNSLGIDMRGFHDAGVNKQDHRGGVKMKGEA